MPVISVTTTHNFVSIMFPSQAEKGSYAVGIVLISLIVFEKSCLKIKIGDTHTYIHTNIHTDKSTKVCIRRLRLGMPVIPDFTLLVPVIADLFYYRVRNEKNGDLKNACYSRMPVITGPVICGLHCSCSSIYHYY